jgi:hypothetical protein
VILPTDVWLASLSQLCNPDLNTGGSTRLTRSGLRNCRLVVVTPGSLGDDQWAVKDPVIMKGTEVGARSLEPSGSHVSR